MKRIQGSRDVRLIECVNPIRGKWRIRWDVQENDDGSASYMEEEYLHKPSPYEVRKTIIGWYNKQIDEDILSGFRYKGCMVWLSSENQFNYKAAHDLAVQTDGVTLPVTFKLGTDDSPVYMVFNELTELTEFYKQIMLYIQDVLKIGWKRKDAVDMSRYDI